MEEEGVSIEKKQTNTVKKIKEFLEPFLNEEETMIKVRDVRIHLSPTNRGDYGGLRFKRLVQEVMLDSFQCVQEIKEGRYTYFRVNGGEENGNTHLWRDRFDTKQRPSL